MADNDNGSSRSSDSEQGEEDSNPLTIAAKAGAKLSTPAKASISRQRKIQTNPPEKKRNVRSTVDPNVFVGESSGVQRRVSYCCVG